MIGRAGILEIYCVEIALTQLDLEELTTDQDLIRFEELLQQKGRIAYTPEQRPAFADEGPGVEFQ
ncbi:MAG: hypothetical protein D3925_01990 [Candidatus Electrothrix sp. AR5]|nr:hypothetical protein [Candidatus Electrothrix sp. AR5]